MAQEFTKIIEIQLKSSGLLAELTKLSQAQMDLVKSQNELDAAYKKGNISSADYAKQTTVNKEAIKALGAQMRQYSSEIQNNIKVTKSSQESYNQLAAQYAINTAKLNEMSAAERENTSAGTTLVKNTEEIRVKMSKLNESIGNHTLSVGNYGKAFNGVNMAMQQVMREVPNLALSPQIFFLAISNNIPILIDQINALKAANIAAAESGGATMSVGKAIFKSIFSWQSAMVMGILLLTKFGASVVEWIGGLFKATSAINANKMAIEDWNKVKEDSAKSAATELSNADLLYKASQNQKKSISERTKAVIDLQKQYPDYFGGMSKEEILAGKATSAYRSLRDSIIEVARAQAAKKLITEKEEQILINEQKIAKLQEEANKKQAEISKMTPTTDNSVLGAAIADYQSKEYGRIVTEKEFAQQFVNNKNKEIESINKQNTAIDKTISLLASKINIQKLDYDYGKSSAKEAEGQAKKGNKRIEEQLKISEKWNAFVKGASKKGGGESDSIDSSIEVSQEDIKQETPSEVVKSKLAEIQDRYNQEILLVQNNELEIQRIKIQTAQETLDYLNGLSDEQKDNETATGQVASAATIEAEKSKQEAIKKTAEVQLKTTEQQIGAAADMFGAMSKFMEEFAGQNESMVILSKALALVEIGLNTAKAVSGAIASAQSVPFPGNIFAIVTGITAVLSAMVQAKQALSNTKMPDNDVKAVKRPKFHTGGIVPGSGEVDATLLAGERVMTTKASNMFSGVLQSMELAASGNRVSLGNYQGGNGMEFFKEAFSAALRDMPSPTVSVVEFERVQSKIKIGNAIVKT